jgi:opacity protein-like surface antigen
MTQQRNRVTILAVALTLLFAADVRPSAAQGFISPFIGYDFSGDSGCPAITGCEDKHVDWGVSIGSLGAVLGGEFDFAYYPDFFGETPGVSSSVLTAMGNLLVGPRLGPAQPYGLVGVGLIKIRTELVAASLVESANSHFGWDIGGGMMVGGRRFGVRGDIRYFHAFQDLEVLGVSIADEKVDFGRASAGVVFKF